MTCLAPQPPWVTRGLGILFSPDNLVQSKLDALENKLNSALTKRKIISDSSDLQQRVKQSCENPC